MTREEFDRILEEEGIASRQMNGLKNALKCAAASVEATEPDAKGHVFVYRDCQGCGSAMFCGKVMGLMERHLNDRATLARLLKR